MFLWLLYALLVAAQADNCPLNSPSVNCYTNTLFVLDATNYLTNTDIRNELNFTLNYVLPGLSFPNQQATFVSFGAGTAFTPLTSIYSMACAQLTNLIVDATTKGGTRYTLTSLMNQIYQDYSDFIGPGFNIQLFSASTDTNDINAAGAFVRKNMNSVQFTVVSLSYNGGYWNSFPYTSLYIRQPWSLEPSLGPCLISNSCGYNDCQRTTTIMPTTTTPTTATTTTTFTTTTLPTTTAPALGPACQCNYYTSWNDIMFLFESSSFVGYIGLQELLGYVQTSMAYFNIQKSGTTGTNYYTQVGIITYSNTASVVNRLGLLSGNDLATMTDLPYLGGTGTNLNQAFEYATNELFGGYSRSNARPVIVVVGSSYTSGSYPNPTAASAAFQKAGGIVITYNYLTAGQSANPTLLNITSPGYFITNFADNGHTLPDDLCNANCRCPTGAPSSAYDVTGKPVGGCFTPVETLGNFQVATNKCNLLGGNLAMGKTAAQDQFLESLFSTPNSNFLGGMKWDAIDNIYKWIDGSPVTGSYQPWFNNATHQQGRDCVYVYSNFGNLQWVPTDCRNGFFYACQAAPCDSTRYCQ